MQDKEEQPYIQNTTRNNQQIAAQTRQTTRKGKKTKHAYKNMEINGKKTNKQTEEKHKGNV
jgi:hypothetical protein